MLASIRVCHLRTRDRNLSEVKSNPWKLVRQFLPCTSSTLSLTFRNAWSSSFCKSASETSNILPFKASFAFFRPVVLFTNVLPTLCRISTKVVRFGWRSSLLPDLERWRCLMIVSKAIRPESSWYYLDWEPIFSSERILGPLLKALLPFGKTFVSVGSSVPTP